MNKAKYWRKLPNGKIECELCPRACKLNDGQTGACLVRSREGDMLVSVSYGQPSGFCIDPIEKKPLYHFFPGTPVLSFGTAGCNLMCRFCQNWDLSRKLQKGRVEVVEPEEIAQAAMEAGCRSLAFTYNDPIVFAEYAIDTADACRRKGIRTVAVTNGYMNPQPRADFYSRLDAANIDLKAFSERFYREICGAELAPVLDTLKYVKKETKCWLEITTLIIPGENDSETEIGRLAEWVGGELGTDVPLHFSAFHPAYKMMDTPATSPGIITKARRIAMDAGLKFVYSGNVRDIEGSTTACPHCREALIVRDGFSIKQYNLDLEACCRKCGDICPGVFGDQAGDWGETRVPILV